MQRKQGESAPFVENWRDRPITILVTPLLNCSLRIPDYAMVAARLSRHRRSRRQCCS
jgi:Fe2+ transport system protein B